MALNIVYDNKNEYYKSRLLWQGFNPSAGDMVWTHPRHEEDYEIYLTDHDGCTIYFQKENGKWKRIIENATLSDIYNIILLFNRAKKK